MSTAPSPSATEHDRRWLVLVLVCIAQFMVVLDATVVNVALPSIQARPRLLHELAPVGRQRVHARVRRLPAAGRPRRRLHRPAAAVRGRRVVVFTVASLLNGLATSSEWLIATRALQGLGAAMVSPAALSIVTTTFKDGAERAKALAVWAAIAVGGARRRPAARRHPHGVPVMGVGRSSSTSRSASPPSCSRCASCPESRVPSTSGMDVAGAVSVTAGLTLLVYAIVRTQDYGWPSAQTFGLALASVALLAAFVFDRAALEGAAGAPRHLPHPLAHRRQPLDARRGRRDVLRLLLRLALRAGDPRLHARSRPAWRSCR